MAGEGVIYAEREKLLAQVAKHINSKYSFRHPTLGEQWDGVYSMCQLDAQLVQMILSKPEARGDNWQGNLNRDIFAKAREVGIPLDGIDVTITDHAAGTVETQQLPPDDYILITGEQKYVSHVQDYPTKGTSILTIKRVEGA